MIHPPHFLCQSGNIAGFEILLKGDLIIVMEPDGGPIHKRLVTGLAKWMSRSMEIRLLYYTLPDGDRVIAAYSQQDDCFGYAYNIDYDWCSEWGYMPAP